MQILIVGLGLIGGSLAKALNKNFTVHGFDKDNAVLKSALSQGIIKDTSKNFKDYDFIIAALPPKATVEYLNGGHFKDNATVCDVCGVKGYISENLRKDINYIYIGTHPMAGKEKGGLENSSADLFLGASIIFTVEQNTSAQSLKLAEDIFMQAGFARAVKCSPKRHDEIIAYTSQLAHIVSNAYVKSKLFDSFDGFTGGSFQDMTRIAEMDAGLWSELFIANCKNLSSELEGLIGSLNIYLEALKNNDFALLLDTIQSGSDIKSGKAAKINAGC